MIDLMKMPETKILEHTESDAPQSLEAHQELARERMLGRIDGLVNDAELREVLRQVGYAGFEKPESEEGEDPLNDDAVEALRAEHKGKIDELVSYTDIFGLQNATKGIFDFRGKSGVYKERWEADGAIFRPELDHQARELAAHQGLLGNTLPEHDHYDVQLNLGGAANSMLYRQSYGSIYIPMRMRLMGRTYGVDTEVNLGSTRPVEEAERKRSLPYAEDAVDEWDLGMRAAETVYGIKFEPEDIYEGTDPDVIGYVRSNVSEREAKAGVLLSETEQGKQYNDLRQRLGSIANQDSAEAQGLREELESINLPQPPNKWRVAAGKAPDGHDVFAISAGLQSDVWDPNGIRKIRPNTADTYVLLRNLLRDVEPGGRVLVVTSAHFTGFQGADAERLAYDLGLDVDVVGFDPTTFGEAPKPTHELLQEIHSKVSSTIGTARYVGALPKAA
jgi:hypothetical protein